jgi:hypothetical protein
MRAVSLGACPLILALSWSCGGGGSSSDLRDPTPDDLPRMVLQREDLPDGFASVQTCEHQNPVDLSHDFSVTFFERFENDSEEDSTCVVSYVFLTPSADEASRSMRNFDQLLVDLNRPIEGVDGDCSPFHEIDGPRVGEETRILTGGCESCPTDSAQFYWIQFRTGRLLASPRLIGTQCQSLNEAIGYATKQEDKIKTVLRTNAND